MGLYAIIRAIALDSTKLEKVNPNIPEAVFKSIVQGTKYPRSLFDACIRRIRAEQETSKTRIAIIKAYLTRNKYKNIKFTPMLNKDITNVGYLCGRLFAVLEKAQEEAISGIKITIRSRYMNAATTSPSTVFPTLLNLSIHHTDKLSDGRARFFEITKSEIIDKFENGQFPAHLDLNEQGCFMIGYYQQRQDFFKKNSEKNNDNE